MVVFGMGMNVGGTSHQRPMQEFGEIKFVPPLKGIEKPIVNYEQWDGAFCAYGNANLKRILLSVLRGLKGY